MSFLFVLIASQACLLNQAVRPSVMSPDAPREPAVDSEASIKDRGVAEEEDAQKSNDVEPDENKIQAEKDYLEHREQFLGTEPRSVGGQPTETEQFSDYVPDRNGIEQWPPPDPDAEDNGKSTASKEKQTEAKNFEAITMEATRTDEADSGQLKASTMGKHSSPESGSKELGSKESGHVHPSQHAESEDELGKQSSPESGSKELGSKETGHTNPFQHAESEDEMGSKELGNTISEHAPQVAKHEGPVSKHSSQESGPKELGNTIGEHAPQVPKHDGSEGTVSNQSSQESGSKESGKSEHISEVAQHDDSSEHSSQESGFDEEQHPEMSHDASESHSVEPEEQHPEKWPLEKLPKSGSATSKNDQESGVNESMANDNEPYTPLDTAGTTKHVEGKEVTQMKVKIDGIDYDKLVSDPDLTKSFKTEIKKAVVEEAGNQIEERSIHVDLSKGSVVATIKTDEPMPDKLKSSPTLTNSITEKVNQMQGLIAVQVGTIEVSKEASEDVNGKEANSAEFEEDVGGNETAEADSAEAEGHHGKAESTVTSHSTKEAPLEKHETAPEQQKKETPPENHETASEQQKKETPPEEHETWPEQQKQHHALGTTESSPGSGDVRRSITGINSGVDLVKKGLDLIAKKLDKLEKEENIATGSINEETSSSENEEDGGETQHVKNEKQENKADAAGLDTEKICKEVNQELQSNAEVEKRDQDDKLLPFWMCVDGRGTQTMQCFHKKLSEATADTKPEDLFNACEPTEQEKSCASKAKEGKFKEAMEHSFEQLKTLPNWEDAMKQMLRVRVDDIKSMSGLTYDQDEALFKKFSVTKELFEKNLVAGEITYKSLICDGLKEDKKAEGPRQMQSEAHEAETANLVHQVEPLEKGQSKVDKNAEEEEATQMKLKIDGIDYAKLVLNTELRKSVRMEIIKAVIDELGNGIKESGVHVGLSKGSVVATIKIDEPAADTQKSSATLIDKLKSSSTLTKSVETKISAIKGIDAVQIGSVVVSKIASEASEEVPLMKLKIDGIDYAKLVLNSELLKSMRTEIKKAVIEEVGNDIKESSLHVGISKGSVVAAIKIDLPAADKLKSSSDKLKSSSTLAKSVETKISGIKGIDAVQSGSVVVNKIASEEVAPMKLKIDGIDYAKLVLNFDLTKSVRTEIKKAVIEEIGNDLKESEIHVLLSKGSVVATIQIDEPAADNLKSSSALTEKLKSSSTLTKSVETKVSGIKGIDAVQSGSVVVSKIASEAKDGTSGSVNGTNNTNGTNASPEENSAAADADSMCRLLMVGALAAFTAFHPARSPQL